MKKVEHFGHYKFKNKSSAEIVEFHRGKSGKYGHQAYDHYHRPNPARKGYKDWYLDANSKPVSKNSDASHLYPCETKDEMFERDKSERSFIANISNYLVIGFIRLNFLMVVIFRLLNYI